VRSFFTAARAFHVRRCHRCGQVNTDPQKVLSCNNCGRSVSPFFYFDEGALVFTDNGTRPYYAPIRAPSEYGPLIGVTAVWSEMD